MPVHILPAGRLGGGPLGLLKAMRSVLRGRRAGAGACIASISPTRWSASAAIRRFRRLLAASAAKVPTVLHEQNAVLGRVNRWLAGEAKAIATSYAEVERLKPAHRAKTVLVGNPVREAVVRLGELPFPPFDDTAPLKILVTGGSQGATILGKVVPDGLGLLPSRRCACGCRSSSNAAPTISRRCARAMPRSTSRPSC